MAKKLGYSPVSIIAAGCGTIATAAAASNPVTAPFAVGIGTAASAIVGGTELNEKEQSIREKLDNAIDEAWTTIDNKYRISFSSEDCLLELKREIMGGNTSVDEINRNLKDEKLENSLSKVIRNILEKYSEILNRDAEIIWNDAFLDSTALDIATILVHAMRSVFENVDHLLILKAIAESADRIVKEIKESEGRLTEEIRNQKQAPVMIPSSLTDIPPSVNLIGRDKDIEAIFELLDQNDIVSIHAYGGVGKTAIAKKIINDVKRDVALGNSPYKHVAWITRTGDLKSDFTALNFLFVNEKNTQEENYQQVCTFFQSTPTFLVIDNIDSPLSSDEIEDLNTIVGQTKVLITARADIEYVEEYPLGELDIEDALVLLYWHFTRKKMTIDKIKERADYPFAEKIVEAATRNALYIELIGKMAYADHWTLERLWESLCEDVFGLDSRYPIEYVAHGDDGKLLEHIEKLYKMSNLSECQKEIMSFIALFPPEHSIFFDVFKWAGFEDDEVDNLGELQKRGWIERDDEGYLIHTMIKGSVEQQHGKVDFGEERYGILIDELADTDKYMPADMVYTKVRERIIVPDTICRLLINNGSEALNISVLLNNIGNVCRDHAYYEKANLYFGRALKIQEKVLRPDGPETASIYNNIGTVQRVRGKYDVALKYYRKALAIKEKTLGNIHPEMASLFNNIGNLYKIIGNNDTATKYYERALFITERLEEKNQDTASIYNNIGAMHQAQGEYREALKYYNKALKLFEEMLGDEHPDIASTYNNLGTMYQAQGKYEEAKMNYDKALAIREKILGKNHPDMAATYSNIGTLKQAQDKYGEALLYYEKALEIQKQDDDKENFDIALTYNNLGALYSVQKEYEKALMEYWRALKILKRVLGENHPYAVLTNNNIRAVYSSNGKFLDNIEGMVGKERTELKKFNINISSSFSVSEIVGDLSRPNSSILDTKVKMPKKEHTISSTMLVNIPYQFSPSEINKYTNSAYSLRNPKENLDKDPDEVFEERQSVIIYDVQSESSVQKRGDEPQNNTKKLLSIIKDGWKWIKGTFNH